MWQSHPLTLLIPYMPQWIHDRASHIRAENPSMPESESWAIATQQSHSLGKSPKGYGTAQGRATAKNKYNTPRDDEKAAKGHDKEAGIFHALAPLTQPVQDDRIRQIVKEELSNSNLSTHNTHSSHKMKSASIDYPLSTDLINGFSDEFKKIKLAQLAVANIAAKPTTVSKATSSVPKNTLNPATPRYSQVNQASVPGPASQLQPTLNPPPVMR